MKRHGDLWPVLTSFPNLLRASKKAKRGKRFRPSVSAFEFDLEPELWALQHELVTKTYRPGNYRSFYIYEPKKRLISAAPYRDRVVHHALTGILEPIFEPTFIYDSYACRQGKGTHAAVDRCQQFRTPVPVRSEDRHPQILPLDGSRDSETGIARKIKDPGVLWLASVIIDHSNPQEPVLDWFPGDDLLTPNERRRGIPIGNQTSQFFANVYLDPLDHFVKDRLRIKGYVRYVDDLLVFSDDKRHLADVRSQMIDFLRTLRLKLHPRKNTIFPVSGGHSVPWLSGLPDAQVAGQGECVAVSATGQADATGLPRAEDDTARDQAAAHELVGARTAGRYAPAA